MSGSREDQAKVTVIIEKEPGVPWPGLGNLGTWENRTGGSGGSDSTKHREGGMGDLLSYGGPPTMENVVVARRYDLSRDHAVIKALFDARGKARMTVIEQPLDEYKVAFGEPISYTGRLNDVNQGDVNANSNDIRMITLTQDTEGVS
jgi:hypothetical protein